MRMRSKMVSIKFIYFSPLLLFLFIRSFFVTPVMSDETIYINMAKALKEGLIPYKDFFYAHPPLQLLILFPVAQTGNFFLTKIYITLIGLACVFLTYLIAKEIFDERTAFISMLFFLIFPGFLIFGNLAMGTFESLLFFLLSFYFLIKGKLLISAICMSISFFTRYLILLLVPFVLIYILLFKRSILKKYVTYLVCVLFASLFIIYILFGFVFLRDTVIYHFGYNIKTTLSPRLANWIWQYFSLGFFTEFITIISLIFGYFRRDYKLILFSLYSFIYDFTVLLIFKQVIYHYFAFALPMIAIAFGKTFSRSKFPEIKMFLLLILFLSFVSNFKSLTHFFDKNKNYVFEDAVKYTLNFTKEDELIFGDPRIVNYVSFVTGRKIANNYFDSDLKHIDFEGSEKVVKEVKELNPRIIFGTADAFYEYFEVEYEKMVEWNVPGYYYLLLMIRKEDKI